MTHKHIWHEEKSEYSLTFLEVVPEILAGRAVMFEGNIGDAKYIIFKSPKTGVWQQWVIYFDEEQNEYRLMEEGQLMLFEFQEKAKYRVLSKEGWFAIYNKLNPFKSQ